jgi:hypothetical protein
MRLYLAGQISGRPYKESEEEFDAAASKLREVGHFVFSQIDFNREHMITTEIWNKRSILLGIDLQWICNHAQGLALLPTWLISKGAQAERMAADAIYIPVEHWEYFLEEKYLTRGP